MSGNSIHELKRNPIWKPPAPPFPVHIVSAWPAHFCHPFQYIAMGGSVDFCRLVAGWLMAAPDRSCRLSIAWPRSPTSPARLRLYEVKPSSQGSSAHPSTLYLLFAYLCHKYCTLLCSAICANTGTRRGESVTSLFVSTALMLWVLLKMLNKQPAEYQRSFCLQSDFQKRQSKFRSKVPQSTGDWRLGCHHGT